MAVATAIEIEFRSPGEAYSAAQAISRSVLDFHSVTVDPVLGSRRTAFMLSCLLQIGIGVSTRIAGDAIYDAIKTAIQPSPSAPTPSPSASLAHVPVRLRIGQVETVFSAPAIADALEKQIRSSLP